MNDAAHNSNGWGPTDLTVLWSKPLGTGAPFASSPVFANGVGYIGSTDKNIYAFNPLNGDVIWNFTTKAGVLSTPSVANGYVYTGADDGNVYCLSANTGNLVWSVALPNGLGGYSGFGSTGTQIPSPMVVGNNLYIGNNNYIYCLSTSNGAINWNYTWGSAKLYGTPTIVNNVVYIAPSQTSGTKGFLYELNAQTGALINNITIPYAPNPFLPNPAATITGRGISAPVTVDSADNIAFLQQVNMRTFAVNLTSGTILWTYDAYYNPGDPGQWGTNNVAGVLYAAGNVYFNEWYSIICLNAVTGNVTWTTYVSRESDSPLSYYAGAVYADTYLNYVYALNGATGAKESYAFCGPEATQPVPYAGNLYVASGNFNITCYTQSTPTAITTPTITFELRPSNIVKDDATIVAGSISVHNAVTINVYFGKGDSSLPVNISAVTDGNGGFTVKYAPDMVGDWTVTIAFAGDATHNACTSQPQTLTVTQPVTPEPTKTVQSMADLYLVPGIIGIIVAIIVVGAVIILALRKRP